MSKYYYNGIIEINNKEMYVEVEVHAEASGYWNFDIDEVEYLSARTYDEEGNVSDVEITDELKKIVKSKLYKVDFTERTSEPDYYEQ